MGRILKIAGLVMLVYAVACVFANWINGFFGLPSFGSVGSWLFNPLGMLFSTPISSYLVERIGVDLWILGDLFKNGVAWVVGGILAIAWVFLLFTIGWKLLRH